jgi:hypothetical protein
MLGKPNDLLAERCVAAVRIWDEAGRSRMNNCELEWKKRVKAGFLWRHSSKSNGLDFGNDSRLGGRA